MALRPDRHLHCVSVVCRPVCFCFVSLSPTQPRLISRAIGRNLCELIGYQSFVGGAVLFSFSVFDGVAVVCLVVCVSLFLSLCWRSIGWSVSRLVSRWWVGVVITAARRAEPLEAQRAADGGCQDHAQDDATDDDHDFLLQREDGQTETDKQTEGQGKRDDLTMICTLT